MGESAGAFSVGYHLVGFDGRHDGLFRGAIMQSGNALGPASKSLLIGIPLSLLKLTLDSNSSQVNRRPRDDLPTDLRQCHEVSGLRRDR